MKTIGVINWKGGVGKTSISTNMAYALSESWGARVLFIDNDKQGNASDWFNATYNRTLTDMLINNATAREIIQKTRYEGIDLIAVDSNLLDANLAVLKNKGRQDDILKKALAEVQDDYDICIIDNPPDSNVTVLNGLEVTDDVIAVSTIDKFSINGIYQLRDEIENYNNLLGLNIKIAGVLINRFTATQQAYKVIDQLQADDFNVYSTHIREVRNTKNQLENAINNNKSIFETVPACAFAKDLIKFLENLIG